MMCAEFLAPTTTTSAASASSTRSG
jgi:hypothetical protein